MVRRRHRPDLERSYVGFRLQDVHYAIPIARVREIVNPSATTPLPQLPPTVIGVVEHRGDVVPVVDACQQLGLGMQVRGARQKWVLVSAGARSVALSVDRVTEVFGTDDPIRPPPTTGGGDTRGLLGVVSHEDELVFVLDADRFARLVDDMASLSLPPRAGV